MIIQSFPVDAYMSKAWNIVCNSYGNSEWGVVIYPNFVMSTGVRNIVHTYATGDVGMKLLNLEIVCVPGVNRDWLKRGVSGNHAHGTGLFEHVRGFG